MLNEHTSIFDISCSVCIGLQSVHSTTLENVDSKHHPATTNCAVFHTVDVHYFEIFQNVNIVSMIDNPFQTSYEFIKKDPTSKSHTNLETTQTASKLKEMKAHNNSRNLVLGIQPDTPLVACKNSAYWSGLLSYPLHSGVNLLNTYGKAVDTTIDGSPVQ